MPNMALAALILHALATQQATAPSVAVLQLETRGGLSRDTADVVSDQLAATVRESGVFGRVVTMKDLEAALGLEQQRQLMQCTSDSCLAEIAGALSVQFVITGTIGNIGEERVLTLRMTAVKTGASAAVVSERVAGSEARLLDHIPPLVDKLLVQAGLRQSSVVTAVTRARAGPATSPPESRSSSLRLPLLRGAAVVVALSVVGMVVGAGLLAGGVGLRALMPGVPGAGRTVLLWVPAWMGAVSVGALAVMVGLGLLGAGGLTGVAAFILG